MSPRRHLALLAVAAAAVLLAAPPAGARPADGGVELVHGAGRAVLILRGAALGSLDRGRITIVVQAGEPQVLVQGFQWQRRLPDGVVYGGQDLRFRIFRGAWRVVIQGGGIDASAVGNGIVGLRGEGRYSVNGSPYRLWPEEYRTIRLGSDT